MTDVFTLLLAIVLMFGVASLVWWGLAVVARLAPTASQCLALSNALLASSLVAHGLRGQVPSLLAYWGSDLLALAGFAMLRAAVPVVARHPLAWRSALAIWLPTALLLGVLPYEGDLRWHSRLVFMGMAGLALLSAVDAWTQLRRRVRAGMASLLVAPFVAVFLLLLARLVESLLMPVLVSDIRVNSEFNIAWLWSTLLLCLLLNATMAFLVLMRLILRIQRLTQHDPFTDVLNRSALHAAIDTEHARLLRGHGYALVMIDMDRFKQLNDTLGHAAGDAALLRLVQVLSPCVREVDRLGRLGGEEFCVLLPLTDLTGAALVAARMCANLSSCEFEWQGQRWPLTASFGIAEAGPEDLSAEAVLMRADQAMYRAKAKGRNIVQD